MTSISSFVWQLLPFFLTFLFASDTSLAKPVVASTYAEHCGSIVPESPPNNKLLFGASNSFRISNGLFSAKSHIKNHFFPSSSTKFSNNDQFHGYFHFQPGQVHRTHDDGTLQLEGTLVLTGSQVSSNWITGRSSPNVHGNRTRVVFKLSGFWSEAKGKFCMVSTGELKASEHDQVASPPSVVLKLEYPKMSNITTSIIKGSIESLDVETRTTNFEPISLLAYAQRKYEYTMLEQAEESCSHLPQEESVGLDSTSTCSNLVNVMRKETFTSSDLNDFLEYRFLSVNKLVCSEDGTVHLSMVLSNESKPFRSLYSKSIFVGMLLVAEGVWDQHNSKLCLLACRLIGKENNSSVVEDCSLSLTFWFPVTFSLKQRSTFVGRLWNRSLVSNNNANKIASLYSVESYRSFVIPGMKYKYTELDRARKHCQTKDLQPKKIGRYPDVQSQTDMMFHFSNKNLTSGRSMWGNAKLISSGDTYLGSNYNRGFINVNNMSTIIQSRSSLADQNPEVWDVGYTISYTFWDSYSANYTDNSVDIFAEGIYNSTTGTICLVGCKQLDISHNHNGNNLNSNEKMNDNDWDCTFFIQVQLPPLDSQKFKGTGKISSTRNKSDPLYFKPLEVTVSNMYLSASVQEYSRIDAEVILVIISLTVLCICSYLQLHHARKYSTIQPLLSITMLVVLTGGCAVTLILNMEAMLVPNRKPRRWHFFERSGGWVDTTNTIARLLTIVALIINYRLFQLAWGSRSKEESRGNNSCSAEKKSLMFCVPLYIVGALVAWYVHSIFFTFRRTILEELAHYVGLVVDNFLLPQIIFNIFSESKEKVLNPFFYFGVTVVRVVPHIYNTYRAWWYPMNLFDVFANHDGDYYSTLLDVFILFEGLLFVLLIYLQQRFGGRCFLPKRFKDSAGSAGYATVCDSNI